MLCDEREIKSSAYITLFSLLNDDPRRVTGFVSSAVEMIFISTFGFESQTFARVLSNTSAPLYLLTDSGEKATKIEEKYAGFPNFTVIFKAKKNPAAYGVFHTKLWLIKFATFLRVVVCSSNQHLMDWMGWLNSFWYQDFPLDSTVRQGPS